MKALYYLTLIALLASCTSKKTETTEAPEQIADVETEMEAPESNEELGNEDKEIEAYTETNLKDYLGYYVGAFKADKFQGEYLYSYYNKINISIDSFGASTIFGHSVVSGNDRPFKGPFTLSNGTISATGTEPGDDRYDGVFEFEIGTSGTMNGTWIANDAKLTVYQRKYELSKTEYSYNVNNHFDDLDYLHLYNGEDYEGPDGEFVTADVTKFNPSVDTLKAEDIENMYKGDLQVMRNSIYARHGYSFKTRKMRYIFDKYVDWYIPVSTDVRDKITKLELANIELLKRYEEHADNYYDSFGR